MSGIVSKNAGRASGIVGAGDIGADAVDSANIADDAIDSEHYTDGSIDNAHIADDAIDSEHYADGSIDNAHIADDAIDSEHYADGSIDNAHIADDAIDSEHYAAGSIDTAHIADNAVTLAKMAGGTDGNIISFDASGDPVAIATGNDGQVLTSAGAGAPPAFEAAAGGGKVKQIVFVETGVASSGSTTFPLDDTAPLIAEGNLVMTLAITPTASDTKLRIDVTVHGSSSATHKGITAALFQDSTSECLACSLDYITGDTGYSNHHSFIHTMTSGTTSSTSFKVRLGASSGTTYFNSSSGTARYDGKLSSSIIITEYEA